MSRPPRQQSLVQRLRRFFEDNPGEMLSTSDVAIKLGCTMSSAKWAIHNAKVGGLELESVQVWRRKTAGIEP